MEEYKKSDWSTRYKAIDKTAEEHLDLLNSIWQEGPYAPKPGSKSYKQRNPIPLGKLGLSFCLKAKPGSEAALHEAEEFDRQNSSN